MNEYIPMDNSRIICPNQLERLIGEGGAYSLKVVRVAYVREACSIGTNIYLSDSRGSLAAGA